MAIASPLGRRQVIHHYLGRSDDFRTPPVTALHYLNDGVIGLGRIVPLGNRLMLVRIERLTPSLLVILARRFTR